jgi:DNA-binding Lrp family transcriptional regulator
MKPIKALSERERKVLYGLVRCPDGPDAQTAKELGLPQPTFSNIQRRLKRQGYYQVIGIPDLEAIGCEIITTVYGTYSPLSSIEQRKDLERKIMKQFPEIFYMLSGVHKVLMLLTGEDHVNVNAAVEEIIKRYQSNDILERTGPRRINFSIPSTYISRFFDYSQVLYHIYKLEDEVDIAPQVLGQ